MTDTPKDGGPAFPVEVWVTEHGDRVYSASDAKHHGMSMRDWFAGQALAGTLAHMSSTLTPEVAAVEAYQYADAMLAEREKSE